MTVVVVTLNGGFLDGSVHALDLTVGPRMVGFGQTMLDTARMQRRSKGWPRESRWPLSVLGQVGELDAIVGQYGVDAIGNGCHQCFKKGGGSLHVGMFDQLNEGELRSAVDGHEEIEFAFRSAYLGQVDMGVADR